VEKGIKRRVYLLILNKNNYDLVAGGLSGMVNGIK
jgi:hypothetical protein